jgi:hypothetical protein
MKTAEVTAPKRDAIVVAPREVSTPEATPDTSPNPEPEKAWPDPIDFNNHSSMPDAEPAAPEPSPSESPTPAVEPIQPPVEPLKPAEPEPEPEPTQPSKPVDPTPPKVDSNNDTKPHNDANITGTLNSPFLSDAKVEKRPLGAFSAENDATAQPSTEDQKPSDAVKDTNSSGDDLAPAGHDEADTPLPAELQDNLLSIEADTTTPDGPPSANRDDDEQPVGPVSITQQYTPSGSSNTEQSGAIFDTKVYNKALKGPAKKKSSWWLVLWIVLLLVVGTGAGAAVYYFVLPAL